MRFSETVGYDINYDRDVARFMATTSSGSFWTDVFVEGQKSLRHDRDAFKEQVVELIQAGATPQYVELEANEH